MRIVFALVLALIVGVGNGALAHNEKQTHERQHITPKAKSGTSKKKPTPKQNTAKRTRMTRGKKHTSAQEEPKERLTRRQEEIRDAFRDCISRSSPHDPVGDVKRFVFDAQRARETGIWGVIEAFRGSPVHHGHEVCLARAYGLKTFHTIREIRAEQGGLLVPLNSPQLLFPINSNGKDEVPPERRYAREWVVDYVLTLAKDFHDQFGIPLRIGSVIRDTKTQDALVRRKLSPADCRYKFLCSTHTSGSAIDFGTKEMLPIHERWLRDRLLADQRAEKIFFIREYSHFHVFVLPPQFMGEE